MNKVISDSVRLTQIIYNDEIHFKNNESQLNTLMPKSLQKFKYKLQLLSLMSKKENSAVQKDVSNKKEISEAIDKKEQLSTKKNTKNESIKKEKDELKTDSDEFKNLEGLLLNQQILQPAIPLHLKKQLISQGIDIEANGLICTMGDINEKSRSVEIKKGLSTLDSHIKNKKININQQTEWVVDNQSDKKENINKTLKNSTLPLPKNNEFEYKIESNNKNESIDDNKKIHISDLISKKYLNSVDKINDKLIDRERHRDSIKEESKSTTIVENKQLPLNNKLRQHNSHISLDSDFKKEIKNRVPEQLPDPVLINTNMPLADAVKSPLTPQPETSFSSKQLLDLPTWNILHKTDALFSKPNNITYVFKRWGNDNHQIQIRFALENQIQLIASTGRVYQASFENLNQYQGRSTLSLENSEKNSYRHINSIDADKHKEEEY
ncbi:hypothetical protein NA898_08935 [Proteus cibi]|uniref:Type III secretion system protein n=1 Tax=Proteus cibi TaxID=2050966 RepID=A0ABU6EDL5_9GAMM|nr:hypothetical protein [Proteus cibi]MEB6857151.1 hypothetical protein [Proteus cibi]MEB7088670.1 hypothetical protein [Proteus cibi]